MSNDIFLLSQPHNAGLLKGDPHRKGSGKKSGGGEGVKREGLAIQRPFENRLCFF